jgi:hypothetical protein
MVHEQPDIGRFSSHVEIGRCTVLGIEHIVSQNVSGTMIAVPESVVQEHEYGSDVMRTIRNVAEQSAMHKGYRNLQDYQRPDVGVRHVTNTPNTVGTEYGNTLYYTRTDPPIYIKAFDYAGPDIAVLQYAVMAALHKRLDDENEHHVTKLYAPQQYALIQSNDNRHRTIVMQGADGDDLEGLLGKAYRSKESTLEKIVMTAGVRQLNKKMKPVLRAMLRHRAPLLLRQFVNDPFANLHVVQPDEEELVENPESTTQDAWQLLDGATLLDQPFDTPMARRLGRIAGIGRLEKLLDTNNVLTT